MVEIRYGLKTDKENYLHLQLKMFPEEDISRHKIYFDQRLENNELLILTDSSKYVGHLTFRKSISPPFSNSIHVDEFAIENDYQGKGFGGKMIDRLISETKLVGFNKIFLETWNNSKNKAISFYKKRGFKEVGNLYGVDGEVILLLEL